MPTPMPTPTAPQYVLDNLREFSRGILLGILTSRLPDWDDPDITRAQMITWAHWELCRRYGCQNCGAAAGDMCKHDYGCIDSDRRA